jgi:gas vesicle protein
MGKTKKLAVGAAVMGGIGYLAGLLTAPQSGKETRQDIKEVTYKTLTEAEKDLKQLHTELDKVLDDLKQRTDNASEKTKKELTALADKAKDTKEKAREMLSALHEGGADDKDLRKAIKDAHLAIEHLKDYLKK